MRCYVREMLLFVSSVFGKAPHPPIFSFVENRSPFSMEEKVERRRAFVDNIKLCNGREPVRKVFAKLSTESGALALFI